MDTIADRTVLTRAMGCHELQGFLYSPARPPTGFEALPGLVRAGAAQTV